MQTPAGTQPEATARPSDAKPAPLPTAASTTSSTAASPAPDTNPARVETLPAPGVENVREILNHKINPYLSAGLRHIFRDPANVYVLFPV
jgi:hypothetical protein